MVQEEIAAVLLKANDRALMLGSADLTAETAEAATLKSAKTCSLEDSYLHDAEFLSKSSATPVSVGFFIINFDHRRKEQKLSSSEGEAAYFWLDFLISVAQPPGSTLWTNNTAVWDTLSFRNAKVVYASELMQNDTRTRRVQAAFFYNPDLTMYPLDDQELEVRLQQTRYTTDEWIFVPSRELNGLSKQMPDIKHKPCFGHTFNEFMHGKEYSNYAFTIKVRKPRWYAIITGFIPPLLILLPVILAHTLGPMSWYPKRFLVSSISMVTLAFFYVSYLRNLPILAYLTAFDKYIYCLYFWLIGTIVSLALLIRTFRKSTENLEVAKHNDERLFLSRHLRDDLLHFCMFSAFVWWTILTFIYVLWVYVFGSMKFTIAMTMV
eukprot:1939985-Rhodomonas_salina.1